MKFALLTLLFISSSYVLATTNPKECINISGSYVLESKNCRGDFRYYNGELSIYYHLISEGTEIEINQTGCNLVTIKALNGAKFSDAYGYKYSSFSIFDTSKKSHPRKDSGKVQYYKDLIESIDVDADFIGPKRTLAMALNSENQLLIYQEKAKKIATNKEWTMNSSICVLDRI